MTEILIDDDLCARAREAAEREGFQSLEAFVTAAITDRLQHPKRARFLQLAHRLRDRLAAKGLNEDAVVVEFERSRTTSALPTDLP